MGFAACGASASRAEGPALSAPKQADGQVATAAEPAIPLALHRAAYRISLLKATGSKSPTAARGRLLYEFTGSPRDGYSQVFRQITEMQPAEGETRLSDMRSATYEDADGRTFSFYVKTIGDNTSADVVEGRAVKKTNDLLAITLSKPKMQSLDVDDQVLFPTAHIQRIIAAARAGQQIVEARVFDGSDNGRKVFETTAIIGRPITTPAIMPDAAHVPAMDGMRRWPVSISYFEEGQKDQGPAYTLSFELYENGVSRALRFDYGDFILGGELTSLELLSPGQGTHLEKSLRFADPIAPVATQARVLHRAPTPHRKGRRAHTRSAPRHHHAKSTCAAKERRHHRC